jgi:hypothetical protein
MCNSSGGTGGVKVLPTILRHSNTVALRVSLCGLGDRTLMLLSKTARVQNSGTGGGRCLLGGGAEWNLQGIGNQCIAGC